MLQQIHTVHKEGTLTQLHTSGLIILQPRHVRITTGNVSGIR